ncbi:hypothetical protein ACSC95_11810 [Burkholderia vietnamiensis]
MRPSVARPISRGEADKHVRSRDSDELHARFRDAVPAPLGYGSVFDLKESRDSASTTQAIDDLARVRDPQVVFHGQDLSTLNFKSEVLLFA